MEQLIAPEIALEILYFDGGKTHGENGYRFRILIWKNEKGDNFSGRFSGHICGQE